MILHRLNALALLGTALATSIPSTNLGKRFSAADTITTDVVVVGGGSSGTHAAITLKDAGYKTLVLEKKGRLGGHTESYFDEETKVWWDYGVLIFHNTDIVKRYFARLNVTVLPTGFPLQRIATDFNTGKPVNATLYTQEQIQAALQIYAGVIAQWPELDKGMYLPDPVPDDLVLPFAEFVKKYKCEAIMPLAIQFNIGVGDLLTTPTVEVIRIVGLSLMKSFQSAFLQVPDGDTSKLYLAAEKDLAASNSLLLNADITSVERTEKEGVRVVVETPQGCKVVIANGLLVAVQPKLDVVGNFDLSAQETDLFSKFVNTGYYTALLRNAGLPWNVTLYNADPNKPYAFADLPSVSSVGHAGIPRLHGAFYQTARSQLTQPFSIEQVKAEIIATIKRVQAASGGKYPSTEPVFVACSSHAPFYLQVDGQLIKNGFYKDLYALQGESSTFWTGATWRAQDSSALWRFNEEVVVPAVIKSLKV